MMSSPEYDSNVVMMYIYRKALYAWEQEANDFMGICATVHSFTGVDVSNQSRTSPDQIKQVSCTSPDLHILILIHALSLFIH